MSSGKTNKLENPKFLIDGTWAKVTQYEGQELQSRALSLVPLDRLRENVSPCNEHPPKINLTANPEDSDLCELCFLKELAIWFKTELFSWVDSPPCQFCNGKTRFKTRFSVNWIDQERTSSSPNEPFYFIDVEDHICENCNRITKFPRHTDSSILLNTRKGRCSEWAQVFTLICRSLGYRSRLVVDVTDHVWTEVYSKSYSKWLHIDSCEAAVNQPLLYEKGWGKKLSYVVAVGVDDVQDVSWRYSADHESLKRRRDRQMDALLLQNIIRKRNEIIRHLPQSYRRKILVDVVHELLELMVEPKSEEDYCGRTSGDQEWIKSRSEDGGGASQQGKSTIKVSKYKSASGQSKVNILFSSSKDEYRIEGNDMVDSHKGWQSLTCRTENVFRNTETDWKMAYLARKSTGKPGVIEWRIDADQFSINRISITAGAFIKDGGEVIWEIESDDGSFKTVCKNIEKCSFDLLNPCRSVIIRNVLSSPPQSPQIAWQFAQIFRQNLSTDFSTLFGFVIHFT